MSLRVPLCMSLYVSLCVFVRLCTHTIMCLSPLSPHSAHHCPCPKGHQRVDPNAQDTPEPQCSSSGKTNKFSPSHLPSSSLLSILQFLCAWLPGNSIGPVLNVLELLISPGLLILIPAVSLAWPQGEAARTVPCPLFPMARTVLQHRELHSMPGILGHPSDMPSSKMSVVGRALWVAQCSIKPPSN